MTNLREAVEGYLQEGFNVIPIHALDKNGVCLCYKRKDCDAPGKHPETGWEKYKYEVATRKEVDRWFQQGECNIGIVTGEISGIIVLDIDAKPGKNGLETLQKMGLEIPHTRKVITGSGGHHYFFKHPGFHVPNSVSFAGDLPGVDIRGDGGYVVAPPSIHASGNLYQWDNRAEIVDAPEWLIELVMETPAKGEKKNAVDFTERLKEGERNHELNRRAWSLLGRGFNREEVISIIQSLNQYMCDPPLEEAEVTRLLTNTIDAFRRLGKQKSYQDRLVSLALLKDDVTFFKNTADNEIYAHIPEGNRNLKVGGRFREFKDWLNQQHVAFSGKGAPSNALKEAADDIRARMIGTDLVEHNLDVRCNRHEGRIYYDLGCQAVEISPGGWRIVNPPPVFKQHRTQSKQAVPKPGEGDIMRLLKYVNLVGEDEKILYLCSLVLDFIPDVPRFIKVIHGGEGCGKSTATKITKHIVDPATVAMLTEQNTKDEKSFILNCNRHYMVALDNFSRVNWELSDMLAAIVTGVGWEQRMLYEDDETVTFSQMRTFILNGIGVVLGRPDLGRRCLAIELREPEETKEQQELWEGLNEDKPYIMAGIFDTLARAWELKPHIKPRTQYSMADAVNWCCAIAEALGYGEDEFERAYQNNRDLQADEILQGNILTSILLEYGRNIEGTPSEVYDIICHQAMKMNVDKRDRNFPKNAQQMSLELFRMTNPLKSAGIKLERKKVGGKRIISIKV